MVHNVWFGGYRNGGWFGMLDVNETNNGFTGMFPQVASNMVWNPNLPGYTNHGSFYVVATAGNSGSIGLDVTTPSGRDYNSKWNTTDQVPHQRWKRNLHGGELPQFRE